MPRTTAGQHPRSWPALARRRWPRALDISGNPGPSGACWALVSTCGGRRNTTVSLHADRLAAESRKADLDQLGCCGRCCGLHQVVYLGRCVPGATAIATAIAGGNGRG
jgi:hypothetical protein